MSDRLLDNINANMQLPSGVAVRKSKKRLNFYEVIRGNTLIFSFRSYGELAAWLDTRDDTRETEGNRPYHKRVRSYVDKKVCVECRKEFDSEYNAQKLCSPECRKLWNRRYHQEYIKERTRRGG